MSTIKTYDIKFIKFCFEFITNYICVFIYVYNILFYKIIYINIECFIICTIIASHIIFLLLKIKFDQIVNILK